MNRQLQSYISNELETVIHAIRKAGTNKTRLPEIFTVYIMYASQGGPHLIRDLLNNALQETYPECVCSIQKCKRHSSKGSDVVRHSSSDKITGRIINHLKVVEDLLTQIKK